MLKPVRTIAPSASVPLVTLAEVSSWFRIDAADEEAVLEQLIADATERLDGYAGIMGRALINQTWKVNLHDWPCDELRLPLSPVQSITSIKYYDASNVQQTITSTNYSLLEDALSPYVDFISTYSTPAVYDRDDAIEVLFVAGYGAAASSVPGPIRRAAAMLALDWFENREGQNEIPPAVESLLAPFRRRGV